jgi:hypothetical protein
MSLAWKIAKFAVMTEQSLISSLKILPRLQYYG